MKIQIFIDEVKVDESKYSHIFIETFTPMNIDEKAILLEGLDKVKKIVEEKFQF